jgi:TRAP-type C4-dicarboxylate transport system permease small subunit
MIGSMSSSRSVFRLAIDRITTVFGFVALLALGVMAILLVYDVVMRYVVGRPADWVLDVVQLVQVTLAFTAAAPVLKAGGHINMELLPTLVGPRYQRRLAILSNGICSVGCLWMSILSWKTFSRSYQITEAAYGIALPLYPWKFLLPLCFFVLALEFFASFLEHLRNSERS